MSIENNVETNDNIEKNNQKNNHSERKCDSYLKREVTGIAGDFKDKENPNER